MKKIITVVSVIGSLFALNAQEKLLEEVIIVGIRAQDDTPMTYSEVSKEELEERNLGQDLPILLNHLPSVVTTSDAGAGVGYTGIRVRGSDATRVNVTINGIPYNDAESQGTFWVNLPDFTSSVESIQLQRGVGTSTNGTGAFGASLNLLTDKIESEPMTSISNSFGSFNTRKHTLEFGTGTFQSHFLLNGRLSKIASDGYIDRGSSDLSSYFIQAAMVKNKTIIKALAFGGGEETYQAWYGIDLLTLENDRTTNFAGFYTDEHGEAQFYDREVDHYDQDHYQLIVNQGLSDNLILNFAGHYTWGRGYFEQYREDASLEEHAIEPLTIDSLAISTSDLIRRRWLDNDFYGFTGSLKYEKEKTTAILGGGWNQYRGDHFGEVIWARVASNTEIRHRYYDNFGNKDESHVYLKLTHNINDKWSLFTDLQMRSVSYKANGIADGLINESFSFFNPKMGLSHKLSKGLIYASFARAQREPSRTDYENGNPVPEILDDVELGWRGTFSDIELNANVYCMIYTDQLVLTGEIDDVGAAIKENIGKSYRAGLELDAAIPLTKKLVWNPNLTLSRNRNLDMVEQRETETVEIGDTRIGFSPAIVAGSILRYSVGQDFEIAFLSKYVGEQYMGNVEAESSILEAYFVNDFNVSYIIRPKDLFETIRFNILINNLFDVEYVSNGYWGPGYVGYYPQAGINFLGGVEIEF